MYACGHVYVCTLMYIFMYEGIALYVCTCMCMCSYMCTRMYMRMFSSNSLTVGLPTLFFTDISITYIHIQATAITCQIGLALSLLKASVYRFTCVSFVPSAFYTWFFSEWYKQAKYVNFTFKIHEKYAINVLIIVLEWHWWPFALSWSRDLLAMHFT